ncbi:hypothetical protein I7I48_11417 [Histoplasma ohiense]|nr:hypothetical protein I7I48_11417 [Histoplasma ohiense (nom. inval.)]
MHTWWHVCNVGLHVWAFCHPVFFFFFFFFCYTSVICKGGRGGRASWERICKFMQLEVYPGQEDRYRLNSCDGLLNLGAGRSLNFHLSNGILN